MRTLLALVITLAASSWAEAGQANTRGDRCYGRLCYVARLLANDGTAAAPSITFRSDTNTGLYRPSADTLCFAVNGLRSFCIVSSTTGLLEGDSSSQSLRLNATGARLLYGTSGVNITTSLITLDAAAGYIDALGNIQRTAGGASGAVTFEDVDGISIVGVAQTSIPTHSSAAMQRDTNRNALWWKGAAPSATAPWVNLGGGQHPAMERKIYSVEVGQESTATPTWQDAPRLGAGSLTMTIVDAAAAGTAIVGSSPHVTDTRTSVTAAAAGSISSGIASSAWVRLDHGPRWCAIVSYSAKTSARFWLGLSAALPGSSDTNANEHVSFRSSSDASDPNWMACSRDGSTQSCTDTGISVAAAGTAAYQLLCVDCYEGSACVYWVDGRAAVRKTTNLPTSTTKLANYWSVEARAASARTMYVGTSTVETK